MLYPILNPRQKYIFLATLERKDDFKGINTNNSAQKRTKEIKSLQLKSEKNQLSQENKCKTK